MSIKLVRCAVALAAAIPFPALAESLNAKAGAWEMTATSLTKGMPIPDSELARMPAEQRAKFEKIIQARAGRTVTQIRKACLTKEDLDEARVVKSDDEGQCKKKIVSKSAKKIVFEETCAAPPATTTKVTVEARTPESIVVSIDRVLGGANGKVHVDINGRWLGSSCTGI